MPCLPLYQCTDFGVSRCIRHVVQLAIEDLMKVVMQVGLIESKQAMWDYDPKAAENHVFSGGLDVIAAICTLAIKVSSSFCSQGTHPLYLLFSQIQASSQCKEAFQQTQKQFNIKKLLVILLHMATHWGSALKMLKWSHHLSDVCFILSICFSVHSHVLDSLSLHSQPPQTLSLVPSQQYAKTARLQRRFHGQHSALRRRTGIASSCALRSSRYVMHLWSGC